MNEEHELERLVIKNIETVERSCKILTETIDPEFNNMLTSLVKVEFPKIFPGWDLGIDLSRESDLPFEFNPQEWYFKKSGASCYFSVGFNSWDTLPCFSYLAYCTNIENVGPGIWFCENDEFEERFSPDSKFEKEICALYVNNKARLDDAGFEFRDDALYRPFQLDLTTISQDWPNLTPDSIRPLLDALESISQVTDIFDGLVKHLTGRP